MKVPSLLALLLSFVSACKPDLSVMGGDRPRLLPVDLTLPPASEGKRFLQDLPRCNADAARYVLESQSDAEAACRIITEGEQETLVCDPTYKSGHDSWTSELRICCIATDISNCQTESLTIQDQNRQPALDKLPAILVRDVPLINVGQDGKDLDSDGDALQYSCRFDRLIDDSVADAAADCSSLPASSFAFDPNAGTLQWTPLAATSGNFEIAIRALDGQGGVADAIQIVALPVAENNVLPAFTETWTFASNDQNLFTVGSGLEFVSGALSLKLVDQLDHDDSAQGFGAGLASGLVWNGSELTLGNQGGCDGASRSCLRHGDLVLPQKTNLVFYASFDGTASLSDNTVLASEIGRGSSVIGTVSRAAGRLGEALSFNSDLNTRVFLPSPPGQDLTVSFWMKSNQVDSCNGDWFNGLSLIDAEVDGNVSDFGITICNGHASTGVGNPDTTVEGTSLINDDVWHQITVTRKASTGVLQVFVDGLLENEAASANTSNLLPYLAPGLGSPHALASKAYTGLIDEVAIWNLVLDAATIKDLYLQQSVPFQGGLNSRIFAGGESSLWESLAWSTQFPSGKELPGGRASESSSDYPALSHQNLLSQQTALWHFEESSLATVGGADFRDASGLGGHASAVGAVSLGQKGRFGSALTLNGATYALASADLLRQFPLTIQAWILPDRNATGAIVSNRGSCAVGAGFAMQANGKLRIDKHDGSIADVGSVMKANRWQHLLLVYESASKIRVYQNGLEVLNQTVTDFSAAVGGSPHVLIGASSTIDCVGNSVAAAEIFEGRIDEVSIWGRALTASEASELYKRGITGTSFQIRTCAQADCSDGTWTGFPADRPISELQNRSNSLVNKAAPVIDISSITAATTKKYFQYRLRLESEDQQSLCTGLCKPAVTRVSVGPDHFPGLASSISLNSGIPFRVLSAWKESSDCGGRLRYTLSDAETDHFQYWDGTVWRSADGTYEQANDADTVSSRIAAFANGLDSKLRYRVFLRSDGVAACRLQSLELNGQRP